MLWSAVKYTCCMCLQSALQHREQLALLQQQLEEARSGQEQTAVKVQRKLSRQLTHAQAEVTRVAEERDVLQV
jgi:hypothetical protein